MIVGEELTSSENSKYCSKKELVDKMLSKMKMLGSELHRYNPTEWNSFMEVCMAGTLSPWVFYIYSILLQ